MGIKPLRTFCFMKLTQKANFHADAQVWVILYFSDFLQ